MNNQVRAHPGVIKQITRISELHRMVKISQKEVRIKQQEIQRLENQNELRHAEIGNLILSVSVLIINLSQPNQMEDVDLIFMEGEQEDHHVEQRRTLQGVARLVRLIYAVDPLNNPGQDFIDEVNERARDFVL